MRGFYLILILSVILSCGIDRSYNSDLIDLTEAVSRLEVKNDNSNSSIPFEEENDEIETINGEVVVEVDEPNDQDYLEEKTPNEEGDKWQSVSLYQGQALPCYFGAKYDKSIDNKLQISMGDYGDLYVKLIETVSNRSIRECFIQANTTYSIRNIPEGKYYIKTAFGENPQVDENCNFRFKNNSYYKKGENIFDFNKEYTANGVSIPYFLLSLDVEVTFTSGSQYDSEQISESEFNN